MCATDLGRYRDGHDNAAFVEKEREAVFKTWAG
jgi:hypothetical protein